MTTVPSLEEADVKGKRVFVRVDYDLPIGPGGRITDFSKLLVSHDTIKYLIEHKARVIIGSHFGTPGGRLNRKYSLQPIGQKLTELLKSRIFFPENSIGAPVKKLTGDMMPGDVVLLENLDFHQGELKCFERYAKELSLPADIYVNEAFSLTREKRASLITALNYYEEVYAGFNFIREIESLDRLKEPEKPFVVIAGGSGGVEKIEFMDSFLDRADTFLVCGALANVFYKALGYEIGKSELDEGAVYSAKKFISSCDVRKIRLAVPEDFTALRGDLNNYSSSFIISGDRIPTDSTIVDIGTQTEAYIARVVSTAKTVLWYGSPGMCGDTEFSHGTEQVAQALGRSEAYSAVLGVETVSTVKNLGFTEGIDFLSEAGHTAVEYLKGSELPALDALENKVNEKKAYSRKLEDEYAEE